MKAIKKLCTLCVIVLCMYVTAKWPERVVSVSEAGYRVTKTIVITIKDSITSGASNRGVSDASLEEDGVISSPEA